MIYEYCNWTEYRQRFPGIREVDFHRSGENDGLDYHERMDRVYEDALAALKQAQSDGVPYVMFRHGWSTSVGWSQTTSRSVVRGLMRSKVATPFIVRSRCIQHESVFIAAIRPNSRKSG
jgi:hypothetical protein